MDESGKNIYRDRLLDSLPMVRDGIRRAAQRAGRGPAGIRLVAVTKGHEVHAAVAALEAGLSDLGENRIEEIERKSDTLSRDGLRWHLIGHLQGRKAARAWGKVSLLHSLDSTRLAQRLAATAGGDGPGGPLPVLLQVNVSGEETKGGFTPVALISELPGILSLPNLQVKGLMTMAPFTEDEGVVRRAFRGLRELQERLRDEFPGYRGEELSMGMSNDFEVAVEEGSTILRLGTVLFGERPG